ncbi:uncharacterized protein BcabD6B2_17370 [Babesia caballi]|uniref:Uncharacterized protein n=1 Tax=Babesia caballi TaxID=5871 RepID=A0AAV4LPW4_BABCB|nr:hypothetical protein BcabD6B2_17370 [Babesia caballi]
MDPAGPRPCAIRRDFVNKSTGAGQMMQQQLLSALTTLQIRAKQQKRRSAPSAARLLLLLLLLLLVENADELHKDVHHVAVEHQRVRQDVARPAVEVGQGDLGVEYDEPARKGDQHDDVAQIVGQARLDEDVGQTHQGDVGGQGEGEAAEVQRGPRSHEERAEREAREDGDRAEERGGHDLCGSWRSKRPSAKAETPMASTRLTAKPCGGGVRARAGTYLIAGAGRGRGEGDVEQGRGAAEQNEQGVPVEIAEGHEGTQERDQRAAGEGAVHLREVVLLRLGERREVEQARQGPETATGEKASNVNHFIDLARLPRYGVELQVHDGVADGTLLDAVEEPGDVLAPQQQALQQAAPVGGALRHHQPPQVLVLEGPCVVRRREREGLQREGGRDLDRQPDGDLRLGLERGVQVAIVGVVRDVQRARLVGLEHLQLVGDEPLRDLLLGELPDLLLHVRALALVPHVVHLLGETLAHLVVQRLDQVAVALLPEVEVLQAEHQHLQQRVQRRVVRLVLHLRGAGEPPGVDVVSFQLGSGQHELALEGVVHAAAGVRRLHSQQLHQRVLQRRLARLLQVLQQHEDAQPGGEAHLQVPVVAGGEKDLIGLEEHRGEVRAQHEVEIEGDDLAPPRRAAFQRLRSRGSLLSGTILSGLAVGLRGALDEVEEQPRHVHGHRFLVALDGAGGPDDGGGELVDLAQGAAVVGDVREEERAAPQPRNLAQHLHQVVGEAELHDVGEKGEDQHLADVVESRDVCASPAIQGSDEPSDKLVGGVVPFAQLDRRVLDLAQLCEVTAEQLDQALELERRLRRGRAQTPHQGVGYKGRAPTILHHLVDQLFKEGAGESAVHNGRHNQLSEALLEVWRANF